MNDDLEAYPDQYVAFIDLLGFSNLVRKADDPDIRDKVEKLILNLSEMPLSFRNLKFTQFSDCVTISAHRNEIGLQTLLSASRFIAEATMLEGCLVRGGVATGRLKHFPGLIYGEGLLNAAKNDKSGASPRIVLTPEVVSDVMSYGRKGLELHVREDAEDKAFYLHTLVAVEHYDADDEVPFPEQIWTMPEIVKCMCDDTNLPEDVRDKWNWFRSYWNDTVGESLGKRC